jgi:2',3'-cyclic-nucleotide 2'-phosphodiesterase (5'-nucleotidase family)
MARWVNVLKTAEGDASFFVDAGNFVSGADAKYALQMEHVVKAMGVLGYDVVHVTPSDFALGEAFLLEASDRNGLPLLSTNIYRSDTGAPFTATSRVVRRGGIAMAFLGVSPRGAQGTVTVPPGDPSLEIRDPAEAVASELSGPAGSCDVVVVLSSLSFSDSRRLAEGVPGIDFVIVSGVEREAYEKRMVGNALVLKVRDPKRYLGHLEVTLGADGVLGYENPGTKPVPTRLARDPKLQKMFEAYQREAAEKDLEIPGLQLRRNVHRAHRVSPQGSSQR